MNHLIEEVFPIVVEACRKAVVPQLKSRGITILNHGRDLGEVVTDMDKGASQIFLEKIGFPGSFTEEQDDLEARLTALEIFQNDPCDGTGDAIKALEVEDGGMESPVSPTNLTTYLVRNNPSEPFVPKGSIVYHILGEFAVICDGKFLEIGTATRNAQFKSVRYEEVRPDFQDSLFYNHRVAYPQVNAHQKFPKFLIDREMNLEMVPTGGAGLQALQLCRSIIEVERPDLIQPFASLKGINVIFNAQPDWKTWDVDPISVISDVLAISGPLDIYGRKLEANASRYSISGMVHTNGCMFTVDAEKMLALAGAARLFEEENPGLSLLEKNY